MRSCRRSVCFLLLMDSKLPPRVGRAWRPIRWVVHFGPRCINRLVSQSPGWSAQGDQAKGSLLWLGVKGGHCPWGSLPAYRFRLASWQVPRLEIPEPNLSNQTVSSVVQPTVANPTVRNIEPETNTPTNSPCIANASDQTLRNSDKPLSNNSSSPVKRITKQSLENKKQEKKSNEWVKLKETKATKRARILAEKRDQVFSYSLPNRSPSREDFLKDSVKEGKNNDDDSLLKVYSSDDDMSTDRASGGVAILAATDIPTIPVTLNTNLQAVAIRIQTHSLITVCSLYLPPSECVSQTDLNNLIHQLPSPFIISGDLNGYSSFWGSSDSNSRGLQIEQFIADHNLCLLNSDEKTHFHLPTRTFHSVDLGICSPPLLPFLSLTVDNDLYNSDHFPLILTDSRHNPTSHFHPPKYIFNAANWQKFPSLANINSDIIKSSTIDQAIDYVVNVIIEAADNSIPKTSGMRRKQNKPLWNADCHQARKKQKKAWGVIRRHPSTANFINFKNKTKAEFRRIQRRSQRVSWRKFVSSINSKISSRQQWNKVKKSFRCLPIKCYFSFN
ncbi:hypothetical protein AVEN_171825-1 [Araneus ventricosus]|uniref:Endonuclease/exonuclease/phosphatase domain-containing protein n=1 Tax=Araneus ventricosus TaxID=182803 RepID=A0A4Y2SPV9_ARAVE|nr:hypothetical protein AVEN_171825-1 [Araneus ventricosus]